jgi:hypothetical protein
MVPSIFIAFQQGVALRTTNESKGDVKSIQERSEEEDEEGYRPSNRSYPVGAIGN